MRRFLASIVLFFGLQLFLASAGILAYRAKLSLLPVEPGLETVICGDSHARTAIDSRSMPSTVNIAHTSEHFLYTYQKLKLVLSRSNTVKSVVVGVSFHSFSAFVDRYVAYREHFLHEASLDGAVWEMYPRYFLMMDGRGKWFVITHNPVCLLRTVRPMAREMARAITAREYADYSFWGSEYRSDRTRLDETAIANAIKLHFKTFDGEWQGISAHQLAYLGQIVAMCRERNVEVFLLNAPLHPRYAALVPSGYIANYYASIRAVEGDGVHVLDYHDLALPDSCFGDGHHLNTRGAAHLTGLVWAAISQETGTE